MNETIDRGGGKKLRIGMAYVEVTYADEDVFDKLKEFYLACADANVPHIERLWCKGGIIEKKNRFRLEPVGLERQPESADELRTALRHVLRCVAALHDLGYCHCDIRWSNIVVKDDTWYLIDCTLATALTDDAELKHVSKLIKHRFVFDRDGPWSPRYDYYQVGLLLTDCEFGCAPQFDAVRDHLCDQRIGVTDVNFVVAQFE